MATQFTFGHAGDLIQGSIFPAMHGAGNTSETIAESGSNQATTASAPSTGGLVVCRVSCTAAVYVSFGASPNAATSTGDRLLMPAGACETFIVRPGWKGAVVTA